MVELMVKLVVIIDVSILIKFHAPNSAVTKKVEEQNK